MMVARYKLGRLGNFGKCMISTLFPYFLWQWSIPTPLFKFIIFVCLLFMVYIRSVSFTARYNMGRSIDIVISICSHFNVIIS